MVGGDFGKIDHTEIGKEYRHAWPKRGKTPPDAITKFGAIPAQTGTNLAIGTILNG